MPHCFVILLAYRLLKRTPSGDGHCRVYTFLQDYVRSHQDALFELIFSGVLDERDLHELMFFGGDGGSVRRKYNEHWAPFIARVRARQEDLPRLTAGHLDWLLDTHGW